jgi:glycosyltransferase involved in cell wall biosynthesis
VEELIRQKQIEIVICEHPYFAWLAFGLREKTGVKVVIHTHNIEYQRFRSIRKWWWPILKGYEKRSFKKADGLLFISPEDKQFAISNWKISPAKCIDLPYGINDKTHPDKVFSRQHLRWNYGITENEKILLFAGLLNYKPNADALAIILDKINPVLMASEHFKYRIIVCGKDLSPELNELKAYGTNNVTYAGFVNDISTMYKGADVFLNPVMSGGGVKTKVLEAIAADTTVVSTETGAKGIDKTACGDKLVTVADNDWEAFANAIIAQAGTGAKTPVAFYEEYNWEKIVSRLMQSLSDQFPA